jgi:hypothetical protein
MLKNKSTYDNVLLYLADIKQVSKFFFLAIR